VVRFVLVTCFCVAVSLAAHASSRSDLRSGIDALRRHDDAKAVAFFTSAIESGGLSRANLALAYYYRGAEHLKLDRPDEAIADLDQAVAMEPRRFPAAYSDRGIAYRRKGDYAKAIADYGEAIRLWPHWHDWYLNRGIAYAASGQYEDAVADYTKALYYRPGLASAFVLRGDVYLQQGRKAEALAEYRRALKEKSDLLKDYPGVAEKLRTLGEPVAR
jgi:tetratricopeptide (TPR) repeat protein